jgi:hypothetical protein
MTGSYFSSTALLISGVAAMRQIIKGCGLAPVARFAFRRVYSEMGD